METASIDNSLTLYFNRFDAQFLLAIKDHMPVVFEIMELSHEDRVLLATKLPFNRKASEICLGYKTFSALEKSVAQPDNARNTSAYIALTGRGVILSLVRRMKELSGEAVELGELVSSLISDVVAMKAPLLAQAMKFVGE